MIGNLEGIVYIHPSSYEGVVPAHTVLPGTPPYCTPDYFQHYSPTPPPVAAALPVM